jgi:phosphopantothenoylcysteine decarboxylase/phosphopantothenate--cysteine ligase
MYEAVLARAGADLTIAGAAVSDWRPLVTHAQKVKKDGAPSTLELVRTPDILAALGERKNGTFLVGFAAETEDLETNARAKLRAKHLDAIAVNDVSGGGFGTGASELVVLWGESGREALGRAPKRELARRLWDTLLRLRAQHERA